MPRPHLCGPQFETRTPPVERLVLLQGEQCGKLLRVFADLARDRETASLRAPSLAALQLTNAFRAAGTAASRSFNSALGAQPTIDPSDGFATGEWATASTAFPSITSRNCSIPILIHRG